MSFDKKEWRRQNVLKWRKSYYFGEVEYSQLPQDIRYRTQEKKERWSIAMLNEVGATLIQKEFRIQPEPTPVQGRHRHLAGKCRRCEIRLASRFAGKHDGINCEPCILYLEFQHKGKVINSLPPISALRKEERRSYLL